MNDANMNISAVSMFKLKKKLNLISAVLGYKQRDTKAVKRVYPG